jgi:hypothetical protein
MKKRLLILMLAVILLLFIIFLLIRYYSNDTRIEYIENYLNNNYECAFICLDDTPKVIDGEYEYQFMTNDENEIVVTVKYWNGALYTPWGDFPLIRERHIVENFEEEIINYIIENSEFQGYKYDMTNRSIDETVEKLYDIAEKMDFTLVNYGIKWYTPAITLQLIKDGRKIEFTYRYSTNKDEIKNRLKGF